MLLPLSVLKRRRALPQAVAQKWKSGLGLDLLRHRSVPVIRQHRPIRLLIGPAEAESRPERRQLCQNIDIRLTKSKNSQSETASHFAEELMANLSSRVQLEEQFSMLWTSRCMPQKSAPFFMFALAVICAAAFAAEPGSIEGQSTRYRIVITNDYPNDPKTQLLVYELVEEPDHLHEQYSKQIASLPFASQCVAINTHTEIVCRSKGSTILAGVTYRVTRDETPLCPGNVKEYRYTCKRGCKSDVPVYLKINSYEPCS